MNSYQRMFSAIKMKEPKEVPVAPFVMTFAAKFAGFPYSQFVKDGKVLAHAQIKTFKRFNYDYITVSSDGYREASACGSILVFPEDDVPYIIKYPIQKEEDFFHLKLPDPYKAERMADRLVSIKILKEKYASEVPIVGWIESPLAEYTFLRSLMTAMYDLVERPNFVKKVLDFCLEMEMVFALSQIKAGADIIGVGEAVASMVSPDMYRKYSLPYVKKLFAAIHEKGIPVKYHVCGFTEHLLKLFVETGADILVIDSLDNMKKVKRICDERVCIKGNLNPVSVLLQGTPEYIYCKSVQAIKEGGPAGFILSPGCEIPRDTPYENMDAMIRAAREYNLKNA
ncbi:MAG: uroporphyrinogen decarboxylase family protein [Actinobacteria bacterium]|nr:uroporphyrinogen decarboxylase family protein [Actinomycetota bacterium]